MPQGDSRSTFETISFSTEAAMPIQSIRWQTSTSQLSGGADSLRTLINQLIELLKIITDAVKLFGRRFNNVVLHSMRNSKLRIESVTN